MAASPLLIFEWSQRELQNNKERERERGEPRERDRDRQDVAPVGCARLCVSLSPRLLSFALCLVRACVWPVRFQRRRVGREHQQHTHAHTHAYNAKGAFAFPLLSLGQDVLAVSDNEAVYGSFFTQESYTASLGKHRLFGQHFSSVQTQRNPYVSTYELSPN